MKNLFKKLIASAMVATLCISLVSCGDNGLNGWKTVAKESDDGVALEYVAKVDTSATKTVCEVWCNVSGISGETSFAVDLLDYNSKSKHKIIETVNSAKLKESQDGWINLYTGSGYDCHYALITTCDTISINEIVLIGKDGKLLDLTFVEGGVRPEGAEKGGNVYSQEKLDALTPLDPAYSEHPAYRLIDEQDKFPVELIKTKGE